MKIAELDPKHRLALAEQAIWAKAELLARADHDEQCAADSEATAERNDQRLAADPQGTKAAYYRNNAASIRKMANQFRAEAEEKRVLAAEAEKTWRILTGEEDGQEPTLPVQRNKGDGAYLVRRGQSLPRPGSAKSIRSLGLAPVTEENAPNGHFEIGPGEYVIKLGWDLFDRREIRLLTFSADGSAMALPYDDKIKAEIAAAIWAGAIDAPNYILKGTGDLAAVIRRILADRAGFRPTSEIASVADARQYLADRARRIEDEAYEAVQEDVEALARLADY